jgi:hypothetical protein
MCGCGKCRDRCTHAGQYLLPGSIAGGGILMDPLVDLFGLKEALRSHSSPNVMACIFYELLNTAGYTDEDVEDIIIELTDIVTSQIRSRNEDVDSKISTWTEID